MNVPWFSFLAYQTRRKGEEVIQYLSVFKMSSNISVRVFLYLEFQVVLGGQERQHLPYFLKNHQAHILMTLDIRLALIFLQGLVDLGNRGLPLQ